MQPLPKPMQFISSPQSLREGAVIEASNLLQVTYQRAQKESPEFISVFGGVEQSVDVKFSTLIIRAAPEPVLTLYDFVMTTFAPTSSSPLTIVEELVTQDPPNSDDRVASGEIRVDVALAGIQRTFFVLF